MESTVRRDDPTTRATAPDRRGRRGAGRANLIDLIALAVAIALAASAINVLASTALRATERKAAVNYSTGHSTGAILDVRHLAGQPARPHGRACPPSREATSPAPALSLVPPLLVQPRKLMMAVTAYCPCPHCCGRWAEVPDAKRRFADGTAFSRNARVAAVDTAVLPFGTRLAIPGYGPAVAHDRGGAIVGNHIDVMFSSHAEARAWGRQRLEITIIAPDIAPETQADPGRVGEIRSRGEK